MLETSYSNLSHLNALLEKHGLIVDTEKSIIDPELSPFIRLSANTPPNRALHLISWKKGGSSLSVLNALDGVTFLTPALLTIKNEKWTPLLYTTTQSFAYSFFPGLLQNPEQLWSLAQQSSRSEKKSYPLIVESPEIKESSFGGEFHLKKVTTTKSDKGRGLVSKQHVEILKGKSRADIGKSGKIFVIADSDVLTLTQQQVVGFDTSIGELLLENLINLSLQQSILSKIGAKRIFSRSLSKIDQEELKFKNQITQKTSHYEKELQEAQKSLSQFQHLTSSLDDQHFLKKDLDQFQHLQEKIIQIRQEIRKLKQQERDVIISYQLFLETYFIQFIPLALLIILIFIHGLRIRRTSGR